jgi:hypothetical protein
MNRYVVTSTGGSCEDLAYWLYAYFALPPHIKLNEVAHARTQGVTWVVYQVPNDHVQGLVDALTYEDHDIAPAAQVATLGEHNVQVFEDEGEALDYIDDVSLSAFLGIHQGLRRC